MISIIKELVRYANFYTNQIQTDRIDNRSIDIIQAKPDDIRDQHHRKPLSASFHCDWIKTDKIDNPLLYIRGRNLYLYQSMQKAKI